MSHALMVIIVRMACFVAAINVFQHYMIGLVTESVLSNAEVVHTAMQELVLVKMLI